MRNKMALDITMKMANCNCLKINPCIFLKSLLWSYIYVLPAIKDYIQMTIALTELLGKSILSGDLKSFMTQFDLPTNPELHLDFSGNAYDTSSDNKNNGIYLNFDGYTRYKPQYGEPSQRFENAKDELFLDEITIDNNFSKNRKPCPVELPFNLQFGDTREIVLQKLNKKPYDKSSTSYGYCWWTLFDEFRILTAINPEYELIWVRIMKLTLDEKEKAKLKKYLSQQNKNIQPENSKKVLEYIDKLPTADWILRKEDGDELFTDEGITSVETLLKDYLLTLADLATKKKAANIYKSIKKVTTALNKINDRNNGFIETMEREELCEFLNTVVRETGLDIDKDIDLTEEWREW